MCIGACLQCLSLNVQGTPCRQWPKKERHSQSDVDLVASEEEGTDDERTLVEVLQSKKGKTAQENITTPGDDPLPSHSTKPRTATRKCKASAAPSGHETPRSVPLLDLVSTFRRLLIVVLTEFSLFLKL